MAPWLRTAGATAWRHRPVMRADGRGTSDRGGEQQRSRADRDSYLSWPTPHYQAPLCSSHIVRTGFQFE